MGRPLNKRNFGTPTVNGNEIKVQFYNGTASVDGWIVKQLGTKKFRCTDGTATADCTLTDKLGAALTTGEMSITVADDAGAVKQVIKIAAKKVTTDTGESIGWDFSNSTTDGKVEVEEAGAGAIVINVTDAVEGQEYVIVVPGTTDFTLLGAADSVAGTQFVMNAATPAGTGTVSLVSDSFAGR